MLYFDIICNISGVFIANTLPASCSEQNIEHVKIFKFNWSVCPLLEEAKLDTDYIMEHQS